MERKYEQWAAANCAVLLIANAGQYASSNCKPLLFWFPCKAAVRYINLRTFNLLYSLTGFTWTPSRLH